MKDFAIALLKTQTTTRNQTMSILGQITKEGFVINALYPRQVCDTNFKLLYTTITDLREYTILRASLKGPVPILHISHPEGDTVDRFTALVGSEDTAQAAPGTLRHQYGGHRWRGTDAPKGDDVVFHSRTSRHATFERNLFFEPKDWPQLYK